MPLHLCWHTNVFECRYVEIIRDTDCYTKKDGGFSQLQLSTTDF